VKAGGLAFERFESSGGSEWLMRLGRADAPAILFVPPLFEEMNRTRALIVAAMRWLAKRGHGCWLLDLRGTGESESALEDATLDDWRHDVEAAASHVADRTRKPLIASLRGGVLIDDGASARGFWRFAPVDGAALARDMVRAGLMGAEWAGYAPSVKMKEALEAATAAAVAPLRTVRLASDVQAADAKLAGPALWRRSEPGNSAALADAIGADILAWSRQCAA
jgi:alpha-beta hydrolase superfamily lysophospholipase